MTVAVAIEARRPAQLPEDSETFDVTIRKLRLVGAVLKQAGINVDVTRVISDGSVEDSTTGPPQFQVTCLDRDYGALNSGVFGQVVDVVMDGIPYRLVDVGLTGVEVLQLTFEHELVNRLRQQRAPLKAARSSMTRAQFVEVMLREISGEFPVRYVCPEINATQPVAQSTKSTGRSLTSKTLGGTTIRNVRGSGFGLSNLDIRYWDGNTVTLGPSQLKNAATVLQVCKQLGANAKATLAVMAACIVEPAKPFENTVGGTGGSSGILQWIGKPWANDVVASVTNALQDPGATGGGGMISLAQRNPGWTPGQIANAEQGPLSSLAFRYDAAVPGAQTVINSFTSAGGFAATGINFGSPAGGTYEFSRGQPGQPEDSWTCILRLAREVNWRAFVSGRNSFYFVTDDDLLRSAPVYTVTPSTPGFVRLTGNAEVGGRTVRKHRHRQPKPSEAQLTVRIDTWQATPGSVIVLNGWGVYDDRWLAIDTQRPLFDHEATVSLQSPQKPFAEPAASSSSTVALQASITGGTVLTGSAIDQVYAAATAIDRRNLPYVYGGGHTGSWVTAATATGLDCSSSTSLALYGGGLMSGFSAPIVSGNFASWGQPGRGAQMTVWYSSTHVFIEFYGRAAKRFDTVQGGSGAPGPHLRYTGPSDSVDVWEIAGMAPRHYPGL